MFPGDDSCNYDSPFLMYTKKVEAMQKGKGKENMANFIWKITFPFFFYSLFYSLSLNSNIYTVLSYQIKQTKNHHGLVHISSSPADMKISGFHRTKGAVYAIQLEKIFLLSFFQ